jgi:hypothetical protein
MLANVENSPVVEEQSKNVSLKVIENQGFVEPEGLKQIRAMLNDTSRSPANLYNKVLTAEQRKILCFSAGLSRNDISRSFQDLNENARIEIQKALLVLGTIFEVFKDAKALSPANFIDIKAVK